jgi:hypothetical protein
VVVELVVELLVVELLVVDALVVDVLVDDALVVDVLVDDGAVARVARVSAVALTIAQPVANTLIHAIATPNRLPVPPMCNKTFEPANWMRRSERNPCLLTGAR